MLPVIVIGENSFYEPERVLERFRDVAEIRYEDLSTPDCVRQATIGADAVVVGMQRLDDSRIDAFDDQVRVIGRIGVGTDTVDLNQAGRRGITVFNEPSFGSGEVATHAVAMLLALHRKLPAVDDFVRSGWQHGNPKLSPLEPLDELVAGIVGSGRIGRATASLLAPLVKEVIVYDPYSNEFPPRVRRVDDLDALLSGSNLISLHVPLTTETKGILGRRELALLPKGAIVVNVSRGGMIDEEALSDFLREGHIGGAGLDVFEQEPLSEDSPLLTTPNTLLSPHCAGYSERSVQRLESWTVADAISWLTAGRLEHGQIVVQGSR